MQVRSRSRLYELDLIEAEVSQPCGPSLARTACIIG